MKKLMYLGILVITISFVYNYTGNNLQCERIIPGLTNYDSISFNNNGNIVIPKTYCVCEKNAKYYTMMCD